MSRIVDRVIEHERALARGVSHELGRRALMVPVYNPHIYVDGQTMDDIARWRTDHLPGSTDPWSLVREAEEPLHQLLEELMDEVFPRKSQKTLFTDIVARYGVGPARGHASALARVNFG
jgi:hypothetical protein